MSEQRYGYCDEIAAIVDMSKLTIEGGEEMTINDVVERLTQLEAENAALKRGIAKHAEYDWEGNPINWCAALLTAEANG